MQRQSQCRWKQSQSHIVDVKPARKKKLHHIATETAARRHKAVMEGTQHRDDKLRALKANVAQANLRRLESTMSQVPTAAVPAAQATVAKLTRELMELIQASARQRL